MKLWFQGKRLPKASKSTVQLVENMLDNRATRYYGDVVVYEMPDDELDTSGAACAAITGLNPIKTTK